MVMTKILNFLGTRTFSIFFAIASVFFLILSLIMGNFGGWTKNFFTLTLIPFEPKFEFHLKPITILIYSSFGLAISILLLIRKYVSRISKNARLTLALLCFIPEANYVFELFWHFFNWYRNNLIDTPYYIFSTKSNVVLLFFFIALQIVLLFDDNGQNIKLKR